MRVENKVEMVNILWVMFSGEKKSKSEELAPGSVIIENVSKRFKKASSRKQTYTTMKTSLLRCCFFKPKLEDVFLQALNNISVEVNPGSSLGVIGSNGSGKSTLLKLIAGIYRPDEGEVSISGKVSALIELGAGFHPDFTGRENIYLSGVMYGLTRKEIDYRFKDIVRYSELEDFIDDPVRTYSSGMYMRLGFSVAIHTNPDILLVDEVLAVGDASFVNRCKATINDFRRRGKTLIFVTHDLSSVLKWCDDALWLNKGVVRERGNPKRVIDSYLESVKEEEENTLREDNTNLHKIASSKIEEANKKSIKENLGSFENVEESSRWGSKEVEITKIRMLDSKENEHLVFNSSDSLIIEMHYSINSKIDELVFGIGILSSRGQVIHGTNTDIEAILTPLPQNATTYPLKGIVRYKIDKLLLVDGTYFLDVSVHKIDGTPFDYHHRLHKFSVRCKEDHHGIFSPLHTWEFITDYSYKKDI